MFEQAIDPLGPKQRQWVNALKSGHYKQGQGRLKQKYDGSVSYCCLGVANDVLELNESCDVTLDYTYKDLGLRDDGGLFQSGNELADIKCYGNVYISLTEMNDGSEDNHRNSLSFLDIALVIENYWHLIFSKRV